MTDTAVIQPFVNEYFFQAGVVRWVTWDMKKDAVRAIWIR